MNNSTESGNSIEPVKCNGLCIRVYDLLEPEDLRGQKIDMDDVVYPNDLCPVHSSTKDEDEPSDPEISHAACNDIIKALANAYEQGTAEPHYEGQDL